MRPTETRGRRGEPGGVSGSATAQPTTRTTEITVVGANCPWCFNETIDLLRHEPGVVSVDASIAGQCLRIDHHDVEIERLLAVVRGHLHADGTSSDEHVMVTVDPHVAELRCTHGHNRDLASRSHRR